MLKDVDVEHKVPSHGTIMYPFRMSCNNERSPDKSGGNRRQARVSSDLMV